jgi:hypothetical protein
MRPVLLAALLLAPAAASAASSCRWGGPRVELQRTPALVVSRWDVPDSAALDAELTAPGPGLQRYRAWGQARAGDTDAFALLRRQADLYVRLNPRDEPKIRLILRRAVGRVAPMTCLEGLLFEDHQSHFPAERYNEFVALVLRKGGRLRVYSLSSGAGNGSGIGANHIRAHIEADRADGYELELNLHNHPFAPAREGQADIGGTTVPSGDGAGGDLRVYAEQIREWDLRTAAVTNGYDTVRLTPAEVRRLIALYDVPVARR